MGGKTTMLVSFTSNATLADYQPTVYDNYNAITMHNDKPVSLHISDTAGQEDYDHLRPLAYPQTDCFLLCFSLVSQVALSNVKSKWAPELQKYAPGVPIILVGTKKDLLQDTQHLQQMRQKGFEPVSTQQGQEVADAIGAYKYIEMSSLTQENLKSVFDNAMNAWEAREAELKKKRKGECCNIM